MKKEVNIRFLVLLGMTLVAGLWRIFQTSGHVPFSNFTPIGAMALFGGAYFMSRPKAYLLPLLTLLISDIVLMQTVYVEYNTGFLYEGWYVTYFAFGLMVYLGTVFLKKVSFKSVVLSGFLAALSHYIIVDFGVWLAGGLDITTGLPYTRDLTGLLKCYVLALPFFKNMLAGNLIYGALLFGGYELAKYRFPILEKPAAA